MILPYTDPIYDEYDNIDNDIAEELTRIFGIRYEYLLNDDTEFNVLIKTVGKETWKQYDTECSKSL